MPLRLVLLVLLTLVLSACQTARGTRQSWPYPSSPAPAQTAGQGIPGPGPVTAPPQPSTGPQGTVPGQVAMIPQEPAPVIPEATRPPLPDYPRSAEAISGGAVMSLLRQARSALDMAKPEQAQALLERAVRIEPRNYFVWSAMAESYLQQKNYAQAMTVAQKSNSLARGNVYAELQNYRVIAMARDATGDSAGALQAQARVDEIQRMLDQGN